MSTNQFYKILFINTICFFFYTHTYAQQISISVNNPSDFERKDELVILNRDFLQKKMGSLPDNKFIAVFHNNIPKVIQHDDLDKDGIWDEVVFLHNFNAKEKAEFKLNIIDNQNKLDLTTRAYVRHKHLHNNIFTDNVQKDTMPYNNKPTDFSKQKLPPFLTEGPSWENDKVGFRKYYDIRNANDIWGKTTSNMVLDYVGTDASKTYHKLDSWGMDILKVGKSLGAGSIALHIKKNGKDSLIRLGKNSLVTYEQISTGPIRAIFEINYENWKYLPNASPVSISERISIWGGQYFFQNEISLSEKDTDVQISTGTLDFYIDKTNNIFSRSYVALYTHGIQSENKDITGLGIITPIQHFGSFGFTTPLISNDITNAFTLNMYADNPKKYIYRYYAGWEKTDPQFKSKEYFETFLRKEGEKFTQKIFIE